MGIEYIFFDDQFRDRFVQFVSSRGIACSVRQDGMDGLIAELPDGLDDTDSETIDAEYERLAEAEHEAMSATEQDWLTNDAMGVEIRLADGSPCTIRIPAEFIRRLTESFTPEEIHALVSAIANGVENPLDMPICKAIPT